MMDKFEENFEDSSQSDIDHYKELLEQSCHQLNPATIAQLDVKRRHAVTMLEKNSDNHLTRWQPAFAISIAALIFTVLIIFPLPLEQQANSTDIYTDLELLMDEEQLDFLANLDISEWIVSSNDG